MTTAYSTNHELDDNNMSPDDRRQVLSWDALMCLTETRHDIKIPLRWVCPKSTYSLVTETSLPLTAPTTRAQNQGSGHQLTEKYRQNKTFKWYNEFLMQNLNHFVAKRAIMPRLSRAHMSRPGTYAPSRSFNWTSNECVAIAGLPTRLCKLSSFRDTLVIIILIRRVSARIPPNNNLRNFHWKQRNIG